MQKTIVIFALLLALISCSEEKSSAAPAGTAPKVQTPVEPTPAPIDPGPEVDPLMKAKYEILVREFREGQLLCEETQKRWCLSEDEREYVFYALNTMVTALKIKHKDEILETFEKFIDLEKRTLHPKENL